MLGGYTGEGTVAKAAAAAAAALFAMHMA